MKLLITSSISIFPIEIDENSTPEAKKLSICFALIVPTFITPPSLDKRKLDILLKPIFVPKLPRLISPFLDAISSMI